MFLFNISNHPCHSEKTTWSDVQIAEANRIFGEIIDIAFPAVTPEMTNEQLLETARDLAAELRDKAGNEPAAAMVAGHFVMTVYLVVALQEVGIGCYIGDSVRVAEEQVQSDGSIAIIHKFQFAGFRKYPQIELYEEVTSLLNMFGVAWGR